MLLTGRADEPPRLAPAPLATCAAAALDALRALAPKSRLSLEAAGAGAHGLDGAALLGERAAYLGLSRRGAISPGGSCRLLRAADGWIAVSLPRDEDRALIRRGSRAAGSPSDPGRSSRSDLRSGTSPRSSRACSASPCGGAPAALAPPWLRVAARGARRPAPRSRSAPLVLDLSALWAGPLCGRLLALAGARVLKVESLGRPDGGRYGPPGFYAALNADKESVALDLRTTRGVACLRSLLGRADVVIESSARAPSRSSGSMSKRWSAQGSCG
jgi:hypothetical protein